jgi:SAM-dependent methyltransferase
LDASLRLQQVDADAPLPFPDAAFDAVVSYDVVPHLADRTRTFRDVARVLAPGGVFLFTDSAVATGAISSDEVRARSLLGRLHLVPDGFNERSLQLNGLRLASREDRTDDVVRNGQGRLAARAAHAAELVELEGAVEYDRQEDYLRAAVALAERRALSRFAYVAIRD